MQQYFTDIKNLDLFKIHEEDYHHIKDVMRFKRDDKIVVVYDNKKYLCSLLFENDDVFAKIIEPIEDDLSIYPKITLIYGLPKTEKFELVLQKATELGVSTIVPFLSQRSIIRLDEDKASKKLIRWNKIVKEASEQSRRNDIPLITSPITIKDLEKHLGDIKLVADERMYHEGVNSFDNAIKDLKNKKSISIIVGPEGGFDDKEFKEFDKLGIVPVSLGKRILRSETACIYALSILEYFKERDL